MIRCLTVINPQAVCVCARNRRRAHCVQHKFTDISVDTYPAQLNIILPFPVECVFESRVYPVGSGVLFPSSHWDLSDFSLRCQFGLC